MQARHDIRALRLAGILLALLVLSVGSVARAMAPGVGRTNVELRIDTAELEPTLGERLHLALDLQLSDALRERGFEIVAADAMVIFEVRLAMNDVDLHEFAIGVDLIIDGKREVVVDGGRCVTCREQRVVDRIVELVPAVAQRLAEPEPEPPAPCVVPALEPVVEPMPDVRLRLGRLGLTGAVTLAAGVATIGAGGLMMSMPEFPYTRDPRDVGVGILVGGTAAAAVGATLVLVDVVVLEPRGRRMIVRVSPNLSPMNGGVVVSGRF
jgi:hypothetical protein